MPVELIDVTVGTQPDKILKHWLSDITICVPFIETIQNKNLFRPWVNDITIGVEAKFFTVDIFFQNRKKEFLNVNNIEIIRYENLYEHNGVLVYEKNENRISVRPQDFNLPISFTVGIPEYHEITQKVNVKAGELYDVIVPVSKQQGVVLLRNGNIAISSEPQNPENSYYIYIYI